MKEENSVVNQPGDLLKKEQKLKEAKGMIENLGLKLQKVEKDHHKLLSDSQLKHEEFKGEIIMLKVCLKLSQSPKQNAHLPSVMRSAISLQ